MMKLGLSVFCLLAAAAVVNSQWMGDMDGRGVYGQGMYGGGDGFGRDNMYGRGDGGFFGRGDGGMFGRDADNRWGMGRFMGMPPMGMGMMGMPPMGMGMPMNPYMMG